MRTHLEGERRYRRRLPHIQTPGAWYHVTLSLRRDRVLDPRQRQVVLEACRFYEDQRWKLAAVAVMPTLGTHVLCQPLPDLSKEGRFHALEHILLCVKGCSGWRINQLAGTRGPVWERESFDREIRKRTDFWGVVRYIADNPVKAGIVPNAADYPWLYVPVEFAGALEGPGFGADGNQGP